MSIPTVFANFLAAILQEHESILRNTIVYVSGSSKIQTLCHLTQVLLKLRFTAMERLSGY